VTLLHEWAKVTCGLQPCMPSTDTVNTSPD